MCPRFHTGNIADGGPAESSLDRKRIVRARDVQVARFAGGNRHTNARMLASEVETHCALNAESERLLENAINHMGISARGWNRILKVARTIAGLEDGDDIAPAHVAEAIRYWTLDRENQ